jgi:hypothetical protein
MLFRYSFPVPRHGEMVSVTRYVEAAHNPSQGELLSLFRAELRDAQEKALAATTDIEWLDVKNWDEIIFALEHIRSPDLPHLPIAGKNETTVICDTRLKRSAIRINLITPLSLEPRLRLAAKG